MKYLLFAGANYYPSGGADDFQGAFDTLLEARLAAKPYINDYHWAQICTFDGTEFHDEWGSWMEQK